MSDKDDNATKWGPLVISVIKFIYDLVRDLLGRKQDDQKKSDDK